MLRVYQAVKLAKFSYEGWISKCLLSGISIPFKQVFQSNLHVSPCLRKNRRFSQKSSDFRNMPTFGGA